MHTVIGACPHDCPDTCSLVTTVENGKAIRVQGNPHHPMTDPVFCVPRFRVTPNARITLIASCIL
jgi:anaerobic selenocysteine-containing dehydrogenase